VIISELSKQPDEYTRAAGDLRKGRRQRVKNTLLATAFYSRIREILESARASITRSVNTTQVVSNWLVGREIVEEEQKGQDRAEYGEELLKGLSGQLSREYGRGFSVSALQYMRAFFHAYPALLEKQHAPRVESQLEVTTTNISHTARRKSWQPGRLHPNLSWTHYRTLLRVDKAEARAFYEIEAIDNNWAARELERQINSLLYERLALSKDK
jgi:hypothetical protein